MIAKELVKGVLVFIGTIIGVTVLSWLFGIPFQIISIIIENIEDKLIFKFGEWGIAIFVFSFFAIFIVFYYLIELGEKIFKRTKK